MKFEHGAFFNLEFIKAGCLMDDEEKTAVICIMEKKENSGEDENEVAEKLLTEEDYMNVIEENEAKTNGSKSSEKK